jgi:S-adenosylmethionine decarboxylase
MTLGVVEAVGRQLICDCWGCEGDINSVQAIRDALQEAVRRANMTLLRIMIHQFSPQGLTAVAIVAESHVFIHTWPEKKYVALDAFTCGRSATPERIVEVMRAAFLPKRIEVREIVRRATRDELGRDVGAGQSWPFRPALPGSPGHDHAQTGGPYADGVTPVQLRYRLPYPNKNTSLLRRRRALGDDVIR